MGYNIFVLVAEKKALIIDTAYPTHAKQVKDDLEKNGIKPEKVIISHFHPDHAGGSSVFGECEIIGVQREPKSCLVHQAMHMYT